MNILLTGGAGYIGSHLAVRLTEEHHQVVLLDNFSNSHKSISDSLTAILNKSLPLIEGDIRDTALLAKIMRDQSIDTVIHLAGLKAVGESVGNPLDYYANNVQGVISLLQAMKLENVKNLVFSSSATVYGTPQYLPIDEEHPLAPTNPYGRGKLHVEEILKDLSYSDSEWKIICLRYFNPIGAHESGLIGDYPTSMPNNLMPYLAMVANGELPKLKIYGDDYPTSDGTGVRDYIHVMDLAEGHLAAINYMKSCAGWDVFNLGTGLGSSVLEVINSFEKAIGGRIQINKVARRAGDIPQSYTSVEKARSILGWSAKKNMNEMCKSAWKFQKHKNKK
jgi:UDP-glucose 4-epimerase